MYYYKKMENEETELNVEYDLCDSRIAEQLAEY